MDHPAADAPDPGPHARFPWAPALLCAASLAMAGWTWMRYSYAWSVTPGKLQHPGTVEGYEQAHWYFGRYARLHGKRDPSPQYAGEYAVYGDGGIVRVRGRRADLYHAAVVVVGRVDAGKWAPYLDTTASRWHPASVAGLVVAAFGTFVFGLYLRRWVKERGGG